MVCHCIAYIQRLMVKFIRNEMQVQIETCQIYKNRNRVTERQTEGQTRNTRQTDVQYIRMVENI